MIYFDGTYRLKPPDGPEKKPRKEWGDSWRVRIIDFKLGRPDVEYLKPFVIFISPNNQKLLNTSCAESLGKRILRDFQLNLEDTLWVESFPSEAEPIKVASFAPISSFGPDIAYTVSWREIRSNERLAIEAFIPEVREIPRSLADQ